MASEDLGVMTCDLTNVNLLSTLGRPLDVSVMSVYSGLGAVSRIHHAQYLGVGDTILGRHSYRQHNRTMIIGAVQSGVQNQYHAFFSGTESESEKLQLRRPITGNGGQCGQRVQNEGIPGSGICCDDLLAAIFL